MTQPNQSELRSIISNVMADLMVVVSIQKLDNSPTIESGREFIRAHNSRLNAILNHITANYTLTSEVAEREQEAYRRGYIAGGISELTKDKEEL